LPGPSHNLGRGTLVVLDVVPESGTPSYERRRDRPLNCAVLCERNHYGFSSARWISHSFIKMHTMVELHDSTVAEIEKRDGTIIVHLRPAYLHKSRGHPGYDTGDVLVQEARLFFDSASINEGIPDLPCEIMDGSLVVGDQHYENMIPAPLESAGSTKFHLVTRSPSQPMASAWKCAENPAALRNSTHNLNKFARCSICAAQANLSFLTSNDSS